MTSLVPAGLTRCVRAVLVAAPGTLLVLGGGLLVWLVGLVSGAAGAPQPQAVVTVPVVAVAQVSTMTPGDRWLAQGGVEGPSDDVGVQPLGPPGTGSPSKSSGASNSAISGEPVATNRSGIRVSATPDPYLENAAGSANSPAQPLRNATG